MRLPCMMARMSEAGMLMRWRWREAGDGGAEADAALGRQLDVPPLVARLLRVRGLTTPQNAEPFLHPKLTEMHDPGLLPGAQRAAERIVKAIADRQPIVIYGDYDVDGITASAILWHTLKLAGAEVSTYVPHRVEEGYGLSIDAITTLAGQFPVKPLIVSVDCGVTALAPARTARDLGVDLIITDHHEMSPDGLPVCYELVHPRRPGSTYPFGQLCGAGVAFKLAWHVARLHCGSERLPKAFRDLLLDLLSLAALGTIADIVPLVGENRIITIFGLGHVRQTQFIGLNAMIQASGLSGQTIDAYHVGFVRGPRLNACGRMGHAREAVTLLTDATAEQAADIAGKLNSANQHRRETERVMLDEAKQLVLELGMDQPHVRAIVLAREGWHPGVVGIVASRLVDLYRRPTLLLNIDNGLAHGSARSVEGIPIHEVLETCSQLLTSFGGHAMAAGMKLPSSNLDAFRDAIVTRVNELLTVEDLQPVVDIDADCTLSDLTLPMLKHIHRLAPYGRDNPSPMLCVRGATVTHPPTRTGSQSQHLNLTLRHASTHGRAVGFRLGHLAPRIAAGDTLDLVVAARIDKWQGRETVDLHISDLRQTPRD
ncbi:MAG: single-stranded-DNA-specific exonuclease RecJ [Phycisphaeraceae bacterium]|nr:single-stranded-DNA-specific exonuclease RecJ [Phycisphaeraceae bacterium]